MKASELRIGNYVYRQSSKLIIDKSSVYQIENVNLQSSLKYDPIPLTKQWILDLGFKKIIESQYTLNTYEFYGFQIWDKFNDFSDVVYLTSQGETHLETVHHLQNLFFFLKGEELTVNN